MRNSTFMGIASSLAVLGVAIACAAEAPTASSAAASPAGAAPEAAAEHVHMSGPAFAASAPKEVRETVVALRQWSASFHDLDAAAAAGYAVNIGCFDEVPLVGRELARGMGWHVGQGADGFAGVADPAIDVNHPEFLVYAPNKPGASIEDSRLVGFDYFRADPTMTNQPEPLLGIVPFVYHPGFMGWMAHIYLWGHNPDGMFENFNSKVNLCS